MTTRNVIRGFRGPLLIGALCCAGAAYAETETATTPTTTTTTTTKKKIKSNGDVEVKTKTKTVTKGGAEEAALPAAAEPAPVEHKAKHHTKRVTEEKSRTAEVVEPAGKPIAADNTAKNDADKSRIGEKPTADQAKNDKSDIAIMAEIRRAVMAEKGLSVSAHNVKIIAESGVVTLKGPVKSADEKATVMQKAVSVVGMKNVRNDIEIAP